MNKNRLNINDRQLFEYLNSTASETEIRQVEEWIGQGNEHKLYFEKFKKSFETADSYEWYQSINVQQKWEEFKVLSDKQKPKNKVRFLASNSLKIAASILLIIAAGYFIYFFTKPATITYEYAEINPAVKLPDSSIVYLQPGAKLTVNKRFNREAHLEGEAFFSISKDPQHIFMLGLNQSQVQVLGTSFNVKAGAKIEVKLYEGKVRFLSETDTIILQPGQEIAYNTQNKSVVNEQFDDTKTKLQFSGVSFGSVCELLEKKFLYKIQLSGEITDEKVTGQFTSGESIDEIFQVLSKTLEFSYSINNRYITIKTETIKNKSPDENN
ncbi:FecR family protein [Maribellus maritimus]|uniref:FecR family protein n=1 Tax=Maribellus maritimus TaxID=2870838 RepID=UPI001EECECEF|nr:FecR family protein [Maribellus maritimus]MCG6190040.1 FecR family protein [Maribellus maritimus]